MKDEAANSRKLPSLIPQTSSLTRVVLGTLLVLAGLLAAMTLVEVHEDRLRQGIEAGLATLPGVTVWSRAAVRTPTLLLTFDGRDAVDAYEFLAKLDINAPAGSFYALEASRFLGLGDAGGLRVGLAPYSEQDDADRLLAGLTEFLR